jgi:hypothetical protein
MNFLGLKRARSEPAPAADKDRRPKFRPRDDIDVPKSIQFGAKDVPADAMAEEQDRALNYLLREFYRNLLSVDDIKRVAFPVAKFVAKTAALTTVAVHISITASAGIPPDVLCAGDVPNIAGVRDVRLMEFKRTGDVYAALLHISLEK